MYVYILKLVNNTFYCGITNNLERRLKEHKSKGPGYVQRKGFKELVYCEKVSSRKIARFLEMRIKRYGVSKYLVYLRVNKLI